ncbi:hypothetical protein [Micromonospora sp. RTGN7]|uniref:hypothetical protein n=1 Tax=Micromonospora sp. RTGN7 TaxID=3016526 RepID=UPI0029FF1846|nr:hypothetical protein [Micromonospora sp. RTGN7]
MITDSPAPQKHPVRRRTLLGLVPLVAGGLIVAATAPPASAADLAPECLADLLTP